jgi:hypothetical protein
VVARTLLLAAVDGVTDAGPALTDGADLIDISGCAPGAAAAIRASYPGAPLWTGAAARAPVNADELAAGGDGEAPVAAIVAVAAVSAWLGAGAIRTRQVRPARRAIDMTASIAGVRPPALTIRGLA